MEGEGTARSDAAHVITAKQGRVEVALTDGANVKVALARDGGRIFSRPGAGWVDLTREQAAQLRDALDAQLRD
jgi:hypothetical protein